MAWSSNLLVNPGAENGLTGWVIEAGTPRVNVEAGRVRSGSHSFGDFYNTPAAIYQDVNLSGYAGSIDGGRARVRAGGWMRQWGHVGRILIEYLNASKGVIASYDTGEVYPGDWTNYGDERAAPSGTRYLRFHIWGYHPEGATNRCYVDDCYVNVEETAGPTYNCPHCPATFGSQGELDAHIQSQHPSGESLKCPLCGYDLGVTGARVEVIQEGPIFEQLRAAIRALDVRITELQGLISTTREEFNRRIAQLEQEISQIQDEIDKLKELLGM